MTTELAAIPANGVKVEETAPLPTALVSVARHLESAVTGMAPDVLSLELSVEAGKASLKFYAYKTKPKNGGAG